MAHDAPPAFAGIPHANRRVQTTLCGYPSKPCNNERAVKRTGTLHRFCEFHRAKANRNQRRLERRRKLARQSEPSKQPPAPATRSSGSSTSTSSRQRSLRPLLHSVDQYHGYAVRSMPPSPPPMLLPSHPPPDFVAPTANHETATHPTPQVYDLGAWIEASFGPPLDVHGLSESASDGEQINPQDSCFHGLGHG